VPDQEAQTLGTTTFVSDGPARDASVTAQLLGYKSVGVDADKTQQSIAAFMAKPMLQTRGEWTTSQLQGDDIWSQSTTIALNADVYAKKLYGYKNVRGTIVYKIQINAQPFQQGRLLAHFLPMVNDLGGASGDYFKMHNHNLATKTQQPSVEIDCRDTMATLRIPYVNTAQWHDTQAGNHDWGTIYLSVLSQLRTGSGGPTAVDYSVFTSFEDWEMCAPYYPNSSEKIGRGKVRKVKMNTESDNMPKGTISSALGYASSFATVLAGVPLLTSIAEPVAWATRIGANLASSLGFSKPNMDTTATPMVIRPYRNMANSDGCSNAEALALSPNPAVEVMPGFAGNNIDEMSFNHLKQVSCFIDKFEFAGSDLADSAIYTKYIGPSHSRISETTAGTTQSTYITGPPFAILSKCFSHFRGGIRLHFKLMKTDYHSGRLQVIFQPTRLTANVVNNFNSVYTLREIWDVRETAELILELPYLINRAYCETVNGVIGELTIRVMNELKNPTSVSSTVECLVYASACEDFELTAPQPYKMMPVVPQGGDRLLPQGGDEDLDPHTLSVDKPIGNAIIQKETLAQARFCVGDGFTSVKQLINRYSRLRFVSGVTPNTAYWAIYAFGLGAATSADVPTLTSGDYFGDTVSLIYSGYLLSRGGMRYLISNEASSDLRLAATTYYSLLGGAQFTTSTGIAGANSLALNNTQTPGNFVSTQSVAKFPKVGEGVELEVPMYSDAPARPNFYFASSGTSPFSYDAAGVSRTYLECQFDSAPGSIQIYRSASDDAQLGYFIGFPPMLVSHS